MSGDPQLPRAALQPSWDTDKKTRLVREELPELYEVRCKFPRERTPRSRAGRRACPTMLIVGSAELT